MLPLCRHIDAAITARCHTLRHAIMICCWRDADALDADVFALPYAYAAPCRDLYADTLQRAYGYAPLRILLLLLRRHAMLLFRHAGLLMRSRCLLRAPCHMLFRCFSSAFSACCFHYFFFCHTEAAAAITRDVIDMLTMLRYVDVTTPTT